MSQCSQVIQYCQMLKCERTTKISEANEAQFCYNIHIFSKCETNKATWNTYLLATSSNTETSSNMRRKKKQRTKAWHTNSMCSFSSQWWMARGKKNKRITQLYLLLTMRISFHNIVNTSCWRQRREVTTTKKLKWF